MKLVVKTQHASAEVSGYSFKWPERTEDIFPTLWLADMGHRVVGVEISEKALKEFFTQNGLPYREEPVPGTVGAKVLQSVSGNISLYCCSIYDLSSAIVGKFDGVWDRGALVAVNPCDRQCYASLMISLMEKSSSYLLVTVLYDPNKHKGPPFYVPESEVKSLFGNQCEIKCLQKANEFTDAHREWGLDYFLEVLSVWSYAGLP
ncbi:thiopurine S-methyltransferase isoform X3 [Dromaius novaehollandiae]|uniref:thiopurine S-methyltransferase isoform X3 n=1 Tax=Dromaius novaehollandiae TaxID=8790 RepID=UPI00311E8AFF